MTSPTFARHFQLIGQLLDVIDWPPEKFAVRIAVLEEIRDAWAANKEVAVTTLGDRHNTSQTDDELAASELDPNENPAVAGQSSDCPQGSGQEPCASQDLEDSADGRDQLKLTDLRIEDGGSVTSLDLQNWLREGEGCGDSGNKDSDTGGKLSNDTNYSDANDSVKGVFENRTDILIPKPSGDQDVESDGKTGSPQTASKATPVDTTDEHLSLVCKRCGQSFRVGESSYRPFTCPHCQQNSGRRGPSLQVAAGITGNQSNAATPVCVAAEASTKSTRPFPCNMCEKEFKRKDHLADHIRIHANEKPFSCSICRKMFRTKSNCRQHEKTHKDEGGVPQASQATKERVSSPLVIKSSLRLPIAKRQQMSTAVKSKTKGNTLEAGPVFDEDSYSTPANGSISHQKTPEGKKSYLCDVCDVVYASKANLIVHRNSHQIQCKDCGTLFPTRVGEHHKKTCASVGSSLKAEAGKGRPTLMSRRILKKYEQIRKTNKAHLCTSCKKVFPTVRDLRCHEQIHLHQTPHVCDTCNKSFNSASHLKVHKRIHTGEKPFRCSLCEWKFSQNGHLKNHWKKVHKLETLGCKYCRKTFLEPDKLRHHEQNYHRVMEKHPAREDLVLDGGDGSTKNISTDDRTKNLSTALPYTNQYACDVCAESFQNLRGLQTHYKVHISKSLFHCEHCRERFSTKSSLSEHVASVHAKILFKCKVGSKGLFSDKDLRAHKKTHQRELQSEPDVSESALAQFPLVPGRAQEDQTKRTYQCHQCEKVFTRKDNLVRHIKTHTKKRPHACNKCGRTFASKFNLTRHKEIQHRPSRCATCREFFPSKAALKRHASVCHKSVRQPGDADVPVTGDPRGQKESLLSDINSNVAGAEPSANSDQMMLGNVEQVKHHCRFCPRILSSRYRLKCHEKRHTNRELFPCHISQNCFSTEGDLLMHMQTHTTETLPSTGNQSSAIEIEMTTQTGNLVKGVKKHECRYCGKMLRKKGHLIEHERIHTGEKPFSCYVCTRSFRTKSSLTSHQASSQHALQYSDLKMAHSVRHFTDPLAHAKLSRNLHQPAHANNCSPTYQHANTNRSQSGELAKANRQHGPNRKLSYAHPNQRKYVQVESPTDRLHHADKSTTHRLAHASKISTPRRTSPAKSPGPTTTQPETPNQSNRGPKTVTQNQSKTFSCIVCHKLFLSQELLQSHERVHAVDNLQSVASTPVATKKNSISGRFICKYCGKTFNNRGHWREHLRVHTGEKPFPCNICGRAFSTKSSAKKHKLIHMKH